MRDSNSLGIMMEQRSSTKRSAFALLAISLGLFGSPSIPAMAAGGTLTMQRSVAIADPSSVSDAIRKECRIEEGMADLIAIHASLPFEKVVRVDRVSGNLPGKVLALTIVQVSALGGGRFTGPKHITMEGTLWDNGQVVGSFRGRWEIGGAASACGSIGFLARSAGLDIGNWLLKPTVGAQFGNPS